MSEKINTSLLYWTAELAVPKQQKHTMSKAEVASVSSQHVSLMLWTAVEALGNNTLQQSALRIQLRRHKVTVHGTV